MEFLNLANALAILGLISLIPSFKKSYKEGNGKINSGLVFTILCALAICIIALFKNHNDTKSDQISEARSDSIQTGVRQLRDSTAVIAQKVGLIDALNMKLDNNTVYLKRLDSFGIKNVGNFPIFSAKFLSNVTTVKSVNQKGGQTARDIINH